MVALVVGRDGHDRAGAIAGEHVVGDPHGDALVVDRIDRVGTGEDAGFFARGVLAVALGFGADGFGVFVHGGALFRCGDLRDERMLGREHHVGRTEQGVGAGRVDGDFFPDAIEREIHERPLGTSDPIFLQQLDRVRPVERVETGQQSVAERGDAQHPLAHRAAFDRKPADLALAVDHFLIGQHGAEFRTPVDRHLGDVGEAHVVRIVSGVSRDGLGAVGRRIEP